MVNKRRKKGGVRHVGACGENHKGTPAGHTYCQKTQGYGPGFRCVAVPGASKGDCVDNAELEFYANNQNHNSNNNNNNGNNKNNYPNGNNNNNNNNNNNIPLNNNNIGAAHVLAGLYQGGESKGERKTHRRTPSSGGRHRKKRRKTRKRKTRKRKTRRKSKRRKSRRRRKR